MWLRRFSWFVIGWNVLTILLGALVRATHSGAGCGRHWPTCQGGLVPQLAGATAIEFTHRAASGIALVSIAILVWLVWRRFPAPHPARRTVFWAGTAILGEALIGAAIVLYEWVGSDSSVARAIAVPIHLVNTLLLLAALTLTTWFISGGRKLIRAGAARRWVAVGGAALVVIAATGAVTALADTLFPSESVTAGLGADFSSTEHFLTRLRIIHPVLAMIVVAAALFASRNVSAAPNSLRRIAILIVLQVGLGVANIAAGTPMWLQLLHLAVADLIWISYVWLAAQVLSSDEVSASADETGALQTNPLHR
jgi:heme A synthase